MDGYQILKAIHVGAVALSGLGFFARGSGQLANARWVRTAAARRLPHVVDTILLASAVGLAWTMRLSPIQTPWLAAKILGLCAYIGLGLVSLRFAKTNSLRLASWLAALLVFGYIVSVATTKNPFGFLA
jgi:uncharacterized membrane protein SirB2